MGVAEKVVKPGDMSDMVKGMRIASEWDAAKLVEAHPLPGRIPKIATRRDTLLAVAYWGGTLRIWNTRGPVRSRHMRQDISAMAWLEQTLVVALADGLLIALDPL